MLRRSDHCRVLNCTVAQQPAAVAAVVTTAQKQKTQKLQTHSGFLGPPTGNLVSYDSIQSRSRSMPPSSVN
jgi:hypothetical protein